MNIRVALIFPLFLASCNDPKAVALNDEVVALRKAQDAIALESTKLTQQLEVVASQLEQVNNALVSERRETEALKRKLDSESSARSALERQIPPLQKGLNDAVRIIGNLEQAIVTRNERQQKAALEAAQAQRERLAQIELQSQPIRARIRDLESKRIAIENRIKAILDNPPPMQTGENLGSMQRMYQQDLAFQQSQIDALQSDAVLLDNAIAAERARLDALSR